ncbi:MAG: type II toxin-antitoxin system HigB family toxin, partial [Leptolyngbyaceae cyanobacterium CSU_1_4]|nr:type II toxin-antitoxin system HigB family toxin [Leptolyngbyaceae cyanobacterium CSU_1_4]
MELIHTLDSILQTRQVAKWSNLVEVQTVFPKAEAVGDFTVFNIKGNHYRLITSIDYEGQLIYIKYILTHAEYNKEKWGTLLNASMKYTKI